MPFISWFKDTNLIIFIFIARIQSFFFYGLEHQCFLSHILCVIGWTIRIRKLKTVSPSCGLTISCYSSSHIPGMWYQPWFLEAEFLSFPFPVLSSFFPSASIPTLCLPDEVNSLGFLDNWDKIAWILSEEDRFVDKAEVVRSIDR